MSGYDVRSGVFELTAKKAAFWLRRRDIPCAVVAGTSGMGFYAAVLGWQGLEVTRVGGSYLHVKATPEQLWEALSGKPSDPVRASYYYRGG